MKRLVCILLMLSMFFSMSTTASAMTIAESTTYVPNPVNLQLNLSVGSRENGTGGDYTYPPDASTSIVMGAGEKRYVDYKAKLDMSLIRSLFEGEFVQSFLPGDAQARAEFEGGIVSTTINVLIEYPAAAMFDEDVQLTSPSVGVLDAGSIFSESARVANGNTLKITYVNKSNLTVNELQANVNSYLKDIEFTLDQTVAYAEEGNHIVKITLSGQTVLDFDSKDQRIIYSGTASNVVNVAKDNTVVNHALEVVPVVPATCFTPGETEAIICRTHNSYDCGALGTKLPRPIPALNHKINGTSLKIHVDAIPATCTQKGILEHWTCALCKNDFRTQESDVVYPHEEFVEAKIPHSVVDLPDIAPTCTNIGLEGGKVCSVCSTVTKAMTIVPALGHTEVELPAVPATCTEPGKTHGMECSVCHTILAAQLDTPATGHKFGDWVVTLEATETTKGLMERICLNGCGEKETREIEKKQHVCVADENLVVVTKEATCTEEGTLQNYCQCGKPVGAPVAIPAKGHTTVAVAGVEATCVTEGTVAHYTCTVCEGEFRDAEATKVLKSIKTPVNKNNHGEGNYVTIPAVAPTCINEGFTAGEKCKNCNIVTTPQEIVPVVPHTLEVVPYKAATCEEHGIKEHKHCKICNKDFDMAGTTELEARDFDIEALGHSYGPAEIYPENQVPVDGHYDGVKRCINGCGEYIEVRIAVTPDTCEHHITMDVITQKATCIEVGERQNVCLLCGKTETTEIPMTAHNLERVEGVAPTCYKKGSVTYYRCLDCGKMFDAADASREITEVQVLDETEHEFREIGGGNNLQCIHCREVVHVKKKDKGGNDDNSDNIKVNNKNIGIKNEKDKVKEDSHSAHDERVTVESEILINEREEVSEKIDTAIESNVPTTENNTIVDKAAWDIEINKVTRYESSGEVDREVVKEIDDVIEIVIKIPDSLKNSIDFLVHRLHVNEQDGAEETHVIGTTPDPITGEYIVIDLQAGTVTLKVKKFSEYVLVGYATVVNNDIPTVGSTGTSSSSSSKVNYTVKFKANGGATVENIVVAKGNVITAPTTTREGYTFAGWYTNAEFTEMFDFTKPITRNITLYAKWDVAGEGTGTGGDDCDGTEADGCVSLRFNDVDTSLWYHLGIDYVVENGYMIGVEEDVFAPDANITRGMLVTVLGRIEGVKEDAVTVEEAFTDVASDEYYANYINWAVENNIVYGYGEGLFGPEDFITREQIAAIMYRYAQFKGYDVSVGENTNILSFNDYSDISEYAISAVQYAVGSGLMKGKTDATFNPVDNSTRAEVATILHRYIEANK